MPPMKYYALDLEFNQHFDFPDKNGGRPEPACPSEIIQIGVALMDESFNITEKKSTLIKPRIYPRIHPYVRRITGLSSDELNDAPSFEDVFEEFFGFAFYERAVFCTWGSDDVKDLYKNILYYGLNAKALTRRYLNVQRLFAVHAQTPPNMQTGLKTAAETLGFQISEPFHDALNDAVYTAKILKLLLEDENVAPHVKIQTLNLSEMKLKISGRVNLVNLNLLFGHMEKLLGRKPDDREKEAALSIYRAGRTGRYDLPSAEKRDEL